MTESQPKHSSTARRDGNVIGIVVVASALVLAALPFFMVGGLAVQIKDEFGFTESDLGAGVTIGFIVGALAGPFGGRIADRIGPRATTYIGAALSGVALLGLGMVTSGWLSMVGFLCFSGLAVGVTDPGLAILVSRTIPTGRQGIAFGIKEASIPAAALAAGIAVPAIALTVGWRWAFAIGLIPFLAVLTLLPRLGVQVPEPPVETTRDDPTPSPPKSTAIFLAASAAALGTAAASGVGIFLTDSAVTMGMSPANAGILLAVGSVAGIVARVTVGAVADRIGGPQFKVIAIMLAAGAMTMALGGTGNTILLIIGTVGAFTGGWAWTGIFFLSLVKTNPARAGAVAGIGVAGLGVGNASGPLLFGVVAQSFSFGIAWFAAAVVAGIAAVLMAMARSRF